MDIFTYNQQSHFRLPLLYEENCIESHECSMLKIILIEQGSTIMSINSKSFVLSAPALICLNDKENFKTLKAEGLTLRIIYFSPDIVNADLNIQNVYNGSHSFSGTANLDYFYFLPFLDRSASSIGKVDIGLITVKKLSALFDELKAQICSYDDRFWPCRNRSYLIQILFLIQHCFSRGETVNTALIETSSDIGEILLYLHLNYDRKLTIEELTGKFHTNRNTMNERFKKEIGLSVFDYIIKLRIRVACMLLRDTKLPVNDIAQRVGFNDISYWGRTFKKATGLTPVSYRKLYGCDSSTYVCKQQYQSDILHMNE